MSNGRGNSKEVEKEAWQEGEYQERTDVTNVESREYQWGGSGQQTKSGKPAGGPEHRFHGSLSEVHEAENTRQWIAALGNEDGWTTLSVSWLKEKKREVMATGEKKKGRLKGSYFVLFCFVSRKVWVCGILVGCQERARRGERWKIYGGEGIPDRTRSRKGLMDMNSKSKDKQNLK